MRWSRAAKMPSLIRRRRVGWPTRRAANGEAESMSSLVSMRIAFELVGVEEVGFVDDEDGVAAAFGVLRRRGRRRLGG